MQIACSIPYLCTMICLAASVCARCAQADTFVLEQGGRIQGRWTNPKKAAGDDYVVATQAGIRLSLRPDNVQRVLVTDGRMEEYRKLTARCQDDVESHWTVAEWCRQMGLHREREEHLQRILEFEPDHAGSRYGLGYSQVRGEWVRQRTLQQRRGYERYDGRWRTTQEIQLLAAKKDQVSAARSWLAQLRRWRQMLATEEAPQAYRKIAAVRDPLAVSGFAELLAEERFRQIKLLYIDALLQIGGDQVVTVLFTTSLSDPDEEVFHACLDALVRLEPPHIGARYAEMLKDENNVRLNRAAHALGRFKDRSVFSPLIDALVTTHTIVLPKRREGYHASFLNPTAGGAGGPNPMSSPLGGTGFSAGDDTRTIPWTVTNQQVLEALIRLSDGANFGFDQRAWRFWLASEMRRVSPDVRGRRD